MFLVAPRSWSLRTRLRKETAKLDNLRGYHRANEIGYGCVSGFIRWRIQIRTRLRIG